MEIIKKVGILCLIVLFVIGIYIRNKDREVYYLNIGSTGVVSSEIKGELEREGILEEYVNWKREDYRITDFINDINSNVKVEEKNIKNILIKADLITISVGENEINYKNDLTYEYIDELLFDYDRLLGLIKEYCKEEKIFIDNFIINDDKEKYFYSEFLKICSKYDFIVKKMTK